MGLVWILKGFLAMTEVIFFWSVTIHFNSVACQYRNTIQTMGMNQTVKTVRNNDKTRQKLDFYIMLMNLTISLQHYWDTM